MGVDYDGCSNCGEGVYEEFIASTECCGESVCSHCVINSENVERDGSYIYAFTNEDGYIKKEFCPHCSEKDLNKLLSSYNESFLSAKNKGIDLLEKLSTSELPLEEKWNIYKNLDESLAHDCWVVHFDSIDEDKFTFYDDFNVDKYQTVCLKDFVESIEEIKADDEEKYDAIDLDALKEEIIKMKLTSFDFDW